jgi:lipoprotein-anchoring transpeptidase ErfK/SrfK
VIVPREQQNVAGRAHRAATEAPNTMAPQAAIAGAAAAAAPVTDRRVGPRTPGWLRALAAALVGATLASAALAFGLARYGGAYARQPFAPHPTAADPAAAPSDPADRAARFEHRLAALAPGNEVYVVVDTYANRLRIYRGKELLREAVCSTGSGVRLRDPRNGKEWIFDTPQGELKVLRKVKDPIWVKPDWAFIEDGYLPPKGMRDRVDDFSLGDYALYMRDGYIIHGTIFQTLLGKRVTHGCIRLGDEDLIFAYKTVPVGARVFLF